VDDGELSPIQLFLLEVFSVPKDPSVVANWGMWSYATEHQLNIVSVINDLKERSYIRGLNSYELVGRMKVPDLREELVARGAPVSGTKAALVERLFELMSPFERETCGEDKDFLIVSDLGTKALAEAERLDETRYLECRDSSLASLAQLDFGNASQCRDRYLAYRDGVHTQTTPSSFRRIGRGIGIPQLRALSIVNPDSLRHLTGSQRTSLTIAAAMFGLWAEDPAAYVTPDFPTSPLTSSVCASHLISAAERHVYPGSDPDGPQIWDDLGPGNACALCVDLVGKAVTGGLEPPLEGCISSDGCPLRAHVDYDSPEASANPSAILSFGYEDAGVDPREDAASRLSQAAQLHEAGLISSTDLEVVKASVMKELLGE
jgi:hypothetical protein